MTSTPLGRGGPLKLWWTAASGLLGWPRDRAIEGQRARIRPGTVTVKSTESHTWNGEGDVIGARALIQTLVDSGVNTCFMNPGTSEMHFVHELDAVPQMRGVLALFEGV